MPNALIPLTDVRDTVSTRIAKDMAMQLARVMGLPDKTRIVLPGTAEAVPMNNAHFGNCCEGNPNYPGEDYVIMRYSEEADVAHALATPVNSNEHMPVFNDPIRDVVVRPVYRHVTFTINLEYNASQRIYAQRWLDDMRTRVSAMRSELYHTLEYHYLLPQPLLKMLRLIHETMEASEAPTGMTLSEYINEYTVLQLKRLENLKGEDPHLAVNERQHESIGWFDFDSSPQPIERNTNESGAYTAVVAYTFNFYRPHQLFAKWPLTVHNKVIPKLLRPDAPYSSWRQVTRRVSNTKGLFDAFLEQMKVHRPPYLQVPEYDDWLPDERDNGCVNFISMVITVSAAEPRWVIDLGNLGEYAFTPYMLEYFTHMGDNLFTRSGSVFKFNLYENGILRNDVNYHFEPGTLKVLTDKDLDLTRPYHLQIGIVRNWHTVSGISINRLRRYPAVAYAALSALGVRLGGGCYRDLKLIGGGLPLPVNPDAPGQNRLVGNPADGGVWPWPWLASDWGDITWPGNTWTGVGWPGGGWDHEVTGESCAAPTWPREQPSYPGMVRASDMADAIERTDDLAGNPIDGTNIGAYYVMYLSILTIKSRS